MRLHKHASLSWHLWQVPFLQPYYIREEKHKTSYSRLDALDIRGKLKLASSSEQCLHYVFIPLHAKWFYKTIVVDITIMCMFIAMCNLCVKPHVRTCTRMLALCVLRIMFMAYLNAVTLFALCRGLVHGFRGKSLSIEWPFFIENNRMIVWDALNDLQGWVVAGLIISKSAAFAFFHRLADLFATLIIRSIWCETGLKLNSQTPFKVTSRDSFAANRDKCNPELSLLNLLHFTRTVWEHASPCVPFVAFLQVFASKQHESCASSKD